MQISHQHEWWTCNDNKKWIKLGHTIPNMAFLVQRKQQQVNVVFRRIDEMILVSYNSIFRILIGEIWISPNNFCINGKWTYIWFSFSFKISGMVARKCCISLTSGKKIAMGEWNVNSNLRQKCLLNYVRT